MPTLHIRSVPEDLYERVQKLAQTRSRSLSAQVVELLYEALKEEEQRREQSKALGAIRRRRFTPAPGTPDSTKLLREDRVR
jgi:plasmid stability protein